MRKRFLNLTLALGLVTGLIAGTMGSASAETPVGSNTEWLFFPWVPNGETMAGEGPWYGSVTIQNLEPYAINISFGSTASGVTNGRQTTLEPFASKTFSAAQMQVASPGGAVTVQSSWYFDANAGIFPGSNNPPGVPGPCAVPQNAQTIQVVRGTVPNTADPISAGNVATIVSVTQGAATFAAGQDYIFSNGAIDWSPAGNEPQPSTQNTDSIYTVVYIPIQCVRGPEIGGIEKHVAAVAGPGAGRTTSAMISVDGYTGIPDEDVPWGPRSSFCHDINQRDCNDIGAYLLGIPIPGTFDGHSYLPIVQLNSDWDSIIHISNIDASSPDFAAVTITFYGSGGQGAFGTSSGQFTALLDQGQSLTLDLDTDTRLPEGFVGSAWITSDYGVTAVVNRQKPSTNMALTNQAAPSLLATTSPSSGTGTPSITADLYRMVAPLVFQNFNGWNTGVNIANIAEFTNTVTVTWYNATGNVVGQEQVTIPAKGMEFIYMPAQQDMDLTPGFVGSAVLTSLLPFHAAIDEVKYTTETAASSADGGQAMSYIATAAGASAGQAPDAHNETSPAGAFAKLSLPLVQKGDPSTGMGDASGINLFNLAYTGAGEGPGTSTIWVWFFQPSGALAAPTLGQPMVLSLPAYANATIYTMSPTGNLSEMPVDFQGSAIVTPTAGSGSIFGVSNNVNYEVDGDGSAVYNLLNQWGQFRMFCSQNGDGTPLSGLAGCIYQ